MRLNLDCGLHTFNQAILLPLETKSLFVVQFLGANSLNVGKLPFSVMCSDLGVHVGDSGLFGLDAEFCPCGIIDGMATEVVINALDPTHFC
jgi:hypothetical protein